MAGDEAITHALRPATSRTAIVLEQKIAAGLATEMQVWGDSTKAIMEAEAQEFVKQQQQLEATFHQHKDGWQQEAHAKIAAANDLAARAEQVKAGETAARQSAEQRAAQAESATAEAKTTQQQAQSAAAQAQAAQKQAESARLQAESQKATAESDTAAAQLARAQAEAIAQAAQARAESERSTALAAQAAAEVAQQQAEWARAQAERQRCEEAEARRQDMEKAQMDWLNLLAAAAEAQQAHAGPSNRAAQKQEQQGGGFAQADRQLPGAGPSGRGGPPQDQYVQDDLPSTSAAGGASEDVHPRDWGFDPEADCQQTEDSEVSEEEEEEDRMASDDEPEKDEPAGSGCFQRDEADADSEPPATEEYVEGSGQYEVLEAVLHPAGVPAEAQEESGPSIAPTRGLWSEEPSSDPAADSYADFIKEKEDEEANAPQAGDDLHIPCGIYFTEQQTEEIVARRCIAQRRASERRAAEQAQKRALTLGCTGLRRVQKPASKHAARKLTQAQIIDSLQL
ncbi:TPA: hypothetical protein ACH3X3_004636 [Trebouxia sp. C0006]